MTDRGSCVVLALFTLLALISLSSGKQGSAWASGGQPPKAAVNTQNALDKALRSGLPVVVKLGSDTCIPCRNMEPIIKELAVEQKGTAIFLSLNVYENRELARQAGVRVIPTILFYDKRGKPKAKREGGMSKEELLKAIKELELNK